MNTSVREAAVAVDVHLDDRFLTVRLKDGRELAVPLDWFPRLREASASERANWRLIGFGEGISWPGIDEDLSVEALLH
ncbi:MAG: DUF2442 domain-containing protein [Solirubrobacterales bacterium]